MRRWNVDIVRDLDGVRIETHHQGLTGDEMTALVIEQESLPGKILAYERTPYSVVDEALKRV